MFHKSSTSTFITVLFGILLFLSCEKDANLLTDHIINEGDITATDDFFKVPAKRVSILDVLSNDVYITSGRTRIVSINGPTNGRVRINEDNTITYTPEAIAPEKSEEPEANQQASSGTSEDNSSELNDVDEENTAADDANTVDSDAEDTDSNDSETPNNDTSENPGAADNQADSTATDTSGSSSDQSGISEDSGDQAQSDTSGDNPNNGGSDDSTNVNQDNYSSNDSASDNLGGDNSGNGNYDDSENENQAADSEDNSQGQGQSDDEEQENQDSVNHTSQNDNTVNNSSADGNGENDSEDENGNQGNSENENQGEENSETDNSDDSDYTDDDDDSDIDENETSESQDDEGDEESVPAQEDTFTYTTETENEDGSVTTETGTVVVEVEGTDSTKNDENEADEADGFNETDYWRNPVIAGTRLIDEKYYDLDTGEIYSKEVNLERGQVQNYIDHENCPQRIKDKWDDRIEVSPSDVNGNRNGLQEIFNAYPRGTLFYLKAGTYQDQSNAVLENDQDVVGAYGAVLDGSGIQGNSEESTRAIRSMERGFICNLRVRNYPTWNDPQDARAPKGAALEVIQNGAILNCEVHSENRGIALIYGSKAMWNKITAGRLGLYGYGSHDVNSPNRRGTIVKYNEWYDCNFNGYDGEHEAGGAKFVQVDGTLWSHNYIHDIPSGAGIWQDGDNRESEVYNNVIIKSHRSVFSELSHTSHIHHNTIEYGTGFGAIYMSNAAGEEAHHNFIRWCRNGITIRDKDRGNSRIYSGQRWRGVNNEIHHNYIWQRPDTSTWTHGMITLFDGHLDPNNTTNKWHDNHYYVDDNAGGELLFSEEKVFAQVFMYSKLAPDSDHKMISWQEWKQKSGDVNSTLEYAKYE